MELDEQDEDWQQMYPDGEFDGSWLEVLRNHSPPSDSSFRLPCENLVDLPDMSSQEDSDGQLNDGDVFRSSMRGTSARDANNNSDLDVLRLRAEELQSVLNNAWLSQDSRAALQSQLLELKKSLKQDKSFLDNNEQSSSSSNGKPNNTRQSGLLTSLLPWVSTHPDQQRDA
ncbi:MAG: hypothetical protein Q9162_000031 [Coniocarpon cinnabarinum]